MADPTMNNLFDLVEDYAAFGVHRSGTATQLLASGWLAGERGTGVAAATEVAARLAAPDHSYMSARFAGPVDLHEALSAAFTPTGHGLDTPPREGSRWFGEAADWLDAPCLLSLLGQNPWFHTPTDLPAVSCTAARTEVVTDALTEAALAIIGR